MSLTICQGDILKVANIKVPVLVLSKDFFNESEEIIGCPIVKKSIPGPLHISISTDDISGFAECEKLSLLDLQVRGWKKIGRIPMNDIINITDAVQGIFDYY